MTAPHDADHSGEVVPTSTDHATPPSWSSPSTVTDAARRIFDSGELLRALHNVHAREQVFPLRIRLRGPGRDQLADNVVAASVWARRLRRDASDRGWRLTVKTVTSRTLGRQELPAAAWLDTPETALALLDTPARRRADRFAELLAAAQDLSATAPDVARAGLGVALARPHAVLDAADDWPVMLSVAAWLAEHSRPGIDVRQVPLPGVHTKLLEQRRALVSALFDACLPEQTIDADADTFESRYGFASRDRQIQLRGTGRALGVPWVDQVRVGWPLSALAGFNPDAAGITEVVIVENKVSFTAVPGAPGRLVIFGGGYAAEDTAGQAPWLTQVRVRYWGDIDTHGLRILARLRRSLPRVESVLMDQDTLLANRKRWVNENEQAEPEDAESWLTDDEARLLAQLRGDAWGVGVRLEQEHLSIAEIHAAFTRRSTRET